MKSEVRILLRSSLPAFLACAFAACAATERKPLGSLAESDTATPVVRSQPPTALPLPPLDAAADAAWTLADGRQMRLADYKGKVVVLDFYATWCVPCRDEAPHLASLQERFGEAGLQVVGLNVGGEEDRAEVPDFVRTLGINYQLALPSRAAIDLFMGGDSSIPQTLVFSREGTLLRHFSGYDAATRRELETSVASAVTDKKG